MPASQSVVRAAFYRGGTSKGIFFRTGWLANYSAEERDRIILAAMGSPDPDGRQIDGLGGGISSLSKIAVVGRPGEQHIPFPGRTRGKRGPPLLPPSHSTPWPGVDYADHKTLANDPKTGWDVVYRFAQVGVREPVVDWGSTCGNLVAAVAQFAVHQQFMNKAIAKECINHLTFPSTAAFPFAMRILAADTGKVIRATLPVYPKHLSHNYGSSRWFVDVTGNTTIAGVPGLGSGVKIETPIGEAYLPTGSEVATILLDDKQVPCSVVDAGLPCIFITPSSLLPFLASSSSPYLTPSSIDDLLSTPPADLDSHPLIPSILERIRHAASHQFPSLTPGFTATQPKICLVGPPSSYITTSGGTIKEEAMDVRIRAVSVGNFHRTVPATMLSALAVARAVKGSIIHQQCAKGADKSSEDSEVVEIRVGQPAGVSTASVTVKDGKPESIVYMRTARRIMDGQVHIPPDVQTS